MNSSLRRVRAAWELQRVLRLASTMRWKAVTSYERGRNSWQIGVLSYSPINYSCSEILPIYSSSCFEDLLAKCTRLLIFCQIF